MNQRLRFLMLGLIGTIVSTAPVYATLVEISTVTAQRGESAYASAALDAADGFAFFGSSSSIISFGSRFSTSAKVKLSPLSYASGITTMRNVANLTAAAFDPSTGFLYYASSQTPAAVEALPSGLNAPPGVFASSITLQTGENGIGAAVVDSVHHFGYFGTGTSPSIVVKVQLPDAVSVTTISEVASLTMPSGLDFLSAAVIDTTNGFAYFASSGTPGAVAKIQLSNFTLAGKMTFNSGEGGVGSAVIDTAAQIGYFGTHDSPGKVVKVDLNRMQRLGSLTLKAGQDDLTSAVGDVANNVAYFGTNTSPGQVISVVLGGLIYGQFTVLPSGQTNLTSAVIDTVNQYAFFGTYTNPGIIAQIDLLAGPPAIQLQPSNASAHAGDTLVFSVTATGRNLTYQWQLNGAPIAGATSSTLSHLVTSADDGSTFNCVVTGKNGSVTTQGAVITLLLSVRAFPNPWRADQHSSIPITFDGLASNSTVKIFNLAAHWVKTLPTASGIATWDLTNDAGEKVASGYYFYLITTNDPNQTVHGKIAVIR